MIISEYPYKGSKNLIRTFSDSGLMIIQNETGVVYVEAVDIYPCKFTYSESDVSTRECGKEV